MKNIMFIAPPAAGKGTQAAYIVEKYNIPHISIGDILREIAKEDSEVGYYVRETITCGKLVKDDIAYQLIRDRLSKDDCKNGYVIDGFPRNLEQAIEYDKILDELGYDIGDVFYIQMDKKILMDRVMSRRVCEDCKTVYNLDELSVTQDLIVCEKCGGRLYQRNDDNLEAFETRYEMYLNETEPIADYYDEKRVLYRINGEKDASKIAKQIDKVIEKNITGGSN